MKTIRIKILLAGILLFSGMMLAPAWAKGQEVKLSRQEKKALRESALSYNFNIMDSLFKAKSFVLEADFLRDRYGYRVPVVSNVNFIRVDGGTGVLQTGSNSFVGYNGVGGVTAEGQVSAWKVTRDNKRQVYNIQFTLMTQIGIYDVLLTVNAANNALATIQGLGPGKLSWEGHLVTVNNSRVFKGYNTI